MSTILSWLGDTFIAIETLFSQWGYQQTPNRETLEGQYYPNWDIFFIPIETQFSQSENLWGQYYPNWGIPLSWLKPMGSNMAQSGNPWGTILSQLGYTFILIETPFSQSEYTNRPQLVSPGWYLEAREITIQVLLQSTFLCSLVKLVCMSILLLNRVMYSALHNLPGQPISQTCFFWSGKEIERISTFKTN